MALPMVSSAEGSLLEVAHVALLRFAWQTWHFVTFRRVLQRVESRFVWQAQYFCDVFRSPFTVQLRVRPQVFSFQPKTRFKKLGGLRYKQKK